MLPTVPHGRRHHRGFDRPAERLLDFDGQLVAFATARLPSTSISRSIKYRFASFRTRVRCGFHLIDFAYRRKDLFIDGGILDPIHEFRVCYEIELQSSG